MESHRICCGFWFFILRFFQDNLTSSPISWSELTAKGFIPRRDVLEEKIYRNHLAHHREKGETPEAAVLTGVFGLPIAEAKNWTAENCQLNFRLVITTFPYWLESNIIHLVLFSTSPKWNTLYLTEKTEEMLQQELPELFASEHYEYAIHINPPNHRSVKNLAHSHIFIRDRQQDEKIYRLLSGLPFSKPDTPPSTWPLKSDQ